MIKSGLVVAVAVVISSGFAIPASPTARADDKRLNDSVVSNVSTIQYRAGCPNWRINVDPKLRLAAQRHVHDVLGNRDLDGDVGSDGSTTTDRARRAGYQGVVSETVGINPALSISPLELLDQWYYRPDYYAIMSDCTNVDIGVWSENGLDRTVVVAVYGKGDLLR